MSSAHPHHPVAREDGHERTPPSVKPTPNAMASAKVSPASGTPRESAKIMANRVKGHGTRPATTPTLLSYSALMGVVISTTVPFLSYDWSSVWPFPLVAGLVAAHLVVCGLFVWPKATRSGS